MKFFYAVQTYYALMLKLLAAEVASRYYNSAMSTFIEELKRAVDSKDRPHVRLLQLERGDVYQHYA